MSNNDDNLLALLGDAYTVIGEFLIDSNALDAHEAGDDHYDQLIDMHNRIANVLGITRQNIE